MPYKNPNSEESISKARLARRKHYHNNKEQYYQRNKEKKQKMKDYVKEIKKCPCSDCGEEYPSYVMDLDHRDMGAKSGAINVILNTQNWDRLKEEVSKCDVVCANCHRERTAKQIGYSS